MILRRSLAALALSLVACTTHSPAARTNHASSPKDAGTGFDASFDAGGLPFLTSLDLSPLALSPAFSPDIHDYYVRCASAPSSVSLSMTASAGAIVGIVEPTAFASTAKESLVLTVEANAAIVVTATALDGASSAYWVRCLPPDFPTLTMTTRTDLPPPLPGYYAVGNGVPAGGEQGYAMILDGNGVPVWYHSTSTGAGAMGVDVLAPNQISYVPYLLYSFGTASVGEYVIDALSPFAANLVETNGTPLDMHELRLLPNGDYLLLSWPILEGVDLTGLPGFGRGSDMIGCVIQEVSPAGETVWSWDALDHFDPVQDCAVPVANLVAAPSGLDAGGFDASTLPGDAGELDGGGAGANVVVANPFHCNSIDVAESGDLLVSARNMDSVFMISKASGAVLWKLGGAAFTKDGATPLALTDDALNGFHQQHDARLQGPGLISLFDDQTGAAGPARGLLIAYDLAAGTAEIQWQYSGAAPSVSMGSMRILPDGSRLIGWGQSFSMNPTFTEVTEAGVAVRAFTFTSGSASYRAIKIDPSELDLTLMRQTSGRTD